MRIGSMDSIAKKKEPSMAGFYVLSAFGAVFVGLIILALWGFVKKVFFLAVQYWYIAILVVLILLFLRRKTRKKKE